MKILSHFIWLLTLLSNSCLQSSVDYFGLTPPESAPKIFAPQFICFDDRSESRGAFSSDEKSFYFTVVNNDFTSQKIFYVL